LSDQFRLVRSHDPLPILEARHSLARRQTVHHLVEHDDAAHHYQIDESLEVAINMSLAVGAPLLVTGEPGTGKTQLAYFLGYYFGVRVRAFHVKSTSTARDLKYDFDAVGYLQSAYAAREGGQSLPRSTFLRPGPLWEAYEDVEPSILLVDEIDKASRDFPNDLLHELDQGWFYHPFDRTEQDEPLRIPQISNQRPVIIITSNVERRLPDAFLRRCIFHHIELTENLVRRSIASRAGDFPNLTEEIKRLAMDRFWELRNSELQKAPSTAEFIVWLAILNVLGTQAADLQCPLSMLPALGTLIKDRNDLERLRSA
jgi:MoxR-like ATPase